MEFKKNELINAVLDEYYNTFSKTLDTSDYVPQKYNKKIIRYIYKNLKKKFKCVNKEYRKFVKTEKKKNKKILRLERKRKIKRKIKKFFTYLKTIFRRKKQRSEVVKEKAESELKANE